MSEELQRMLDEARRNVGEVDPTEASRIIDADEAMILLDVRELDEWNQAHIPGAVHLPMSRLHELEEVLDDKSRKVVVYCAMGTRSLIAADTMKKSGYRDPVSMAGGIIAWHRAGLPIEVKD